jgi:hypothetical protein
MIDALVDNPEEMLSERTLQRVGVNKTRIEYGARIE